MCADSHTHGGADIDTEPDPNNGADGYPIADLAPGAFTDAIVDRYAGPDADNATVADIYRDAYEYARADGNCDPATYAFAYVEFVANTDGNAVTVHREPDSTARRTWASYLRTFDRIPGPFLR